MGPNSLVVFGFTGDLTKRKLLPALYELERAGQLHEDFQIIGVTRRPIDIEELKYELESFIAKERESCDRAALDTVCDRIELADGDISKEEDFAPLRDQLDELIPGSCEAKIFYFAVPPNLFEDVIQNMVKAGIHRCGGGVTSRLLIEKPFGHDLESARKLLNTINEHFGRESIYPIDHYLAKDTAQNILFFRFNNPLVHNLWNNSTVKSVQISALEFIDIQNRVGFYEQTGALRDMIQGHLLQLLALTVMDEPATLNADDVRRQRQLLLRSIRPIDAGSAKYFAARGQYKDYKSQVENQNSTTETFAAVRFEIDSARWRGVPMYLRAGKSMETKITEVNIVFESADTHDHENVLTLRLQPNEGIALSLVTKRPGLESVEELTTLDYCYDASDAMLSDAYARILYDAIRGDQTVFPTDEEILTSWELIQPVLDSWNKNGEGLETYEEGARSIDAADKLLEQDGNTWVHHDAWVCKPRFNKK